MGNGLNPAANPYAPGAGIRPPLLAGRDGELAEAARMIERASHGYADRPRLAIGVRGVGKTVLLLAVRDSARRADAVVAHVQARAVDGFVVALLRALEFELRRRRRRKAAQAALSVLASVAVTVGGISVAAAPAPGRGDSGDLAVDLYELVAAVCETAPLVLTLDELQELPDDQMSAFLVAAQRAAGDGLPLVVVAAGLPGTLAAAAAVESFAERLFATWALGPLSDAEAALAVTAPASEAGGVAWQPRAVTRLVTAAAGYPFFLQHFAASVWDVAAGDPITTQDVTLGVERAEQQLADSLVRARLERLSDKERAYVVALADLGPGTHRSGAVAAALGGGVEQYGTVRSRLIRAGIIYSPAYGRVAFTVPMFDRYVPMVVAET